MISRVGWPPGRDVHGKEFEEWVTGLKGMLELNDRSTNCLTLLRQLYVFTAVSKYSRKYVGRERGGGQ